MWTFEEAEAYLNHTAPPGKSEYGLERIDSLLDLLDHPESSFPCVTIVGTNGKGSVTAFLDSLLRAHGIRTACHIKPHLESVTERIRLHGIDSTPEEFASALWTVKQAVDRGWTRKDRPTYFELVFAAFLDAARRAGVDVALLEAGLGGRLDAVNSVDSLLVILTSVSYDHTELLGDTLDSIAREKLAVVRPGSTLVCGDNPKEVMDVVKAVSDDVGFRAVGPGTCPELESRSDSQWQVALNSVGHLENLTLGLDGVFQPGNASLALQSLEVMATDVMSELFHHGLNSDAIRKGLAEARLPGRWERFDLADGTRWILDGAHNPSALERILGRFAAETSRQGTIIFGMKKTKDFHCIADAIVRCANAVVLVELPCGESHHPDDMARVLRHGLDNTHGFSQIQIGKADSMLEAVETAASLTPADGTILVTGSLYLVGAVGTILKERALIPSGKQVV